MAVDPVAAVVQWFLIDADLALLVEGRIAELHKFAMPAREDGIVSRGWPTPCKAVRVTPTAGAAPDNYGEMSVLRVAVDCYGETPAEAWRVCQQIIRIARETLRAEVLTGDERALLYDLVLDDSPVYGQEPDVFVDRYTLILIASIAEEAI